MDLDKLNNMFKAETSFRDIMGRKIQIHDIICFLPRKRDNHYDNRSLKVGIVKKIESKFIRCHSIDKEDKREYSISNEYSEYNIMIVNEMFKKEEQSSFKEMSNKKDEINKKFKEDNKTTYILFAFQHKTNDKFGFYIFRIVGKFNKAIFLEKIKYVQEIFKDYNMFPYMKYDDGIEGFAISNFDEVNFSKIRKFANTYDIGLCDDFSNCFIEIIKKNTDLVFKYSDENGNRNVIEKKTRYVDENNILFDKDNWMKGKYCIFREYSYSNKEPLVKNNIINLFKRFLNK